MSTRIVRYTAPPQPAQPGRIHFESIVLRDARGKILPTARSGDQFLVNGRPFNGTGAGFNTNSGALDNSHPDDGTPIALMPNYTAYRDIKSLEEISYGGLDESWDAVDYQNVFLAKVPGRVDANRIIGQEEEVEFLANTGGIIPSFHRPYLLNYYQRNVPIPALTPSTMWV